MVIQSAAAPRRLLPRIRFRRRTFKGSRRNARRSAQRIGPKNGFKIETRAAASRAATTSPKILG